MEVHPEDRELIEKLAKLRNIHDQIHGLRTLLPERLLKPTRLAMDRPKNSSPESLAANLSVAASQGSKDIRQFKRDFRSEEMQDLWQKTHAADFPQGQDAWTVDYQGLVERSLPDDAAVKSEVNGTGEIPEDTNEDVKAVVAAFKESHPTLKVEADNDTPIPIRILVNGMSLQIQQEEKENKKFYIVKEEQGKKTTKLTQTIVKSIEESGPHVQLSPLLNMLTSYRDFQFQHCDKCHEIFDHDMAYPMIRRPKPSTENDRKNSEWLAYHRSCAP